MITKKIKIAYLDHSSDFSGGQKSLIALLSVIDRTKIDPIAIIDAHAFKTEKELQKLNVPYAKISYLNIKYLEYLLVPLVILKILWLTNKLKCDILHCNTFKSGLIGAVHTFFSPVRFIFRARLGILLLSHGFLDWIIFKRAHLILANSHYVKRTFTERFGASDIVKVVYNPLAEKITIDSQSQNALRQKYFGDPSHFYFGLIGRVEPFKRLDDVIDAAQILVAQNLKFKILVIGANSMTGGDAYCQHLQSLIKEKALERFFEFTGFVSEIHEITSLLNSVLLCSKGEALSRGIYESQFLGIPVIASNSGGNVELIEEGNTGLLFDAGNSVALANKMNKLMLDEELRTRISKQARQNIIRMFTDKSTFIKEQEEYFRLISK